MDTVSTAFKTLIDPLTLVGSQGFSDGLDQMRENLRNGFERDQTVLSGTVSVTAGVSIGYVIWLVRSGVLISAAMSALPAWRFMDPLPILAMGNKRNDDEDEESLESIIENAADADPAPVDDESDDQQERAH